MQISPIDDLLFAEADKWVNRIEDVDYEPQPKLEQYFQSLKIEVSPTSYSPL